MYVHGKGTQRSRAFRAFSKNRGYAVFPTLCDYRKLIHETASRKTPPDGSEKRDYSWDELLPIQHFPSSTVQADPSTPFAPSRACWYSTTCINKLHPTGV